MKKELLEQHDRLTNIVDALEFVLQQDLQGKEAGVLELIYKSLDEVTNKIDRMCAE